MKIKELLRGLLTDIKDEKQGIVSSFSSFGSGIAVRSRRLIAAENRRGLLVNFLAVVLIGLVVSLLCSVKEGGMDLYLSVMLPFIVIGLCQFGFMSLYESSITYVTLTVILVFLGAALQIMLLLPAENTSGAYKLAIFAGVGTAAGLIAVPVLNYMFNTMKKRLAALVSLAAAGFIYLVLLVAAPSISGTRAWLVIGPVSFQLTEVTKVLAVISLACIFTDDSIVPFRRLIYSVCVLGVHAGGLVLVNELGTLIVISIIFIVLGTAFLPSVKGLAAVVLAGLICVAGLVGFSYKCYKTCYEAPADIFIGESAEITDENTGEAAVQDTAEKKEPGRITRKAADVFYKIRTRLMLVIDPDSLDEYGEGYQAKMARKAMLVTGWLGTAGEFEQNVPVIESDYIFLYVLMKIGIIGAFIVLAMLIAMMMETIIKVSVSGRVTESAAAIGFSCCIVVQSIITAASSAGLIPTVGLTFAFLSDGGSATVMNYIMTYFILFGMRSAVPCEQPRGKKKAEKEMTAEYPSASRGTICRTE